jgi:hypothetical protein
MCPETPRINVLFLLFVIENRVKIFFYATIREMSISRS